MSVLTGEYEDHMDHPLDSDPADLPENVWDEYTELVATLADEALPSLVPISERQRTQMAKDLILHITRDPQLRYLAKVLIAAYEKTS